MVANDWVTQHLADILQISVDRPEVIETTALGVAYLAGLQAGLFASTDEISDCWRLENRFYPKMAPQEATHLYQGWRDAVSRVRIEA